VKYPTAVRSKPRTPARPLFTLLTWLLACLASMQATAGDMDIVGLKLGMTESEAMAALKAHDATLTIAPIKSSFQYNDGVNYFQTEPFLAKIEARTRGSAQADAEFMLYFTPPPKGGRLWAVDRKERIQERQPTLAQYTEALVTKYGKPLATSRGGNALAWEFPAGRPTCLLRPPSDPAFPQFRPRNNNSGDLMGAIRAGQLHKRVPQDLSNCASQMYYLLGQNDGVIGSFHAILLDIAGYATAEQAAGAQVQALEEKAKQTRASKGQAPKL